MQGFKSLHLALLALGGLCLNSTYAASSTLEVLSDSELSATTGQALMSLSYISPTDSTNLDSIRTGVTNPSSGGVGFYKLGLEGVLELNANIRKLQLGCGGVNGAGNCDIDIDYLSLSGDSSTSSGRASSSAKLTNPFIEFAIKNPNSAATREVTGFRLSSEKAEGLITFGLENAKDASNNGIQSGINTLSGYMEVSAQTGLATVNPITITQNGATNPTGVALSGKACSGPYFGGCGLVRTTYTTTDYTLNLTPSQQASLILPAQQITGKRISSAPLTASTTVNGINISGSLNAGTGLGIPLSSDNVSGVLNNLKVNVSIDEDLGLFHKANLNGTPASLALQKENIRWPGTKSIAQQGWWLEFSNPIDIGDITPNKNVDIAMPTIIEALGLVNNQLANQWVYCGVFAINCLAGNISIGSINLPNTATPANLALTNLSLKNQDFAPNCYGGLKFC
jgi:hypothetical protein